MPTVGTNVPRKEGLDKIAGRALYVDDLAFPGMLYGRTVRSPVPRGTLERVTFRPGVRWDEIVVVDYRDIPGRNVVRLIQDDQPFLVEREIRHREEPILLLAHADRAVLERAAGLVDLAITPAEPVLTLDDSLAGAHLIVPDNLFASYDIVKGDVEAGFREADLIVEGSYQTEAQEHLYIEPQGMIAAPNDAGGITVWGSLQCPYYVHKALTALLGLPDEKVQVIQAATGGGFGGKEEYPSVIAGHAALLARKARRPVKIVYDRMEDMRATTKRHPARIRQRTGVTRDGRITAMAIDYVLDGGAYATLSPVVLSRGTIHAPGPYRCAHVHVRSRAMATNAPPHGAFRGFGAPQSIFGLEVHLDRVAAAVGVDPAELRRRNLLRPGDRMATGQRVPQGTDLEAVLATALRESDYHAKREAFARGNAASAHCKRGIGLATFFHGAGFTGSGEVHLASRVALRLAPDGRVEILTANTEIGQGMATTFSQIVSDALEIPYEMAGPVPADTAVVPNSGPTVASRTCMIVGGLLREAAADMLEALRERAALPPGHTPEDFREAARRHHRLRGPLLVTRQYRPPPGSVPWDDTTYRGDAYGAYAWACYVAEVEVDLRTYAAEVADFVAVQDVGTVIHPVIARGQIEGGVAQGIGYALYEHVAWQDGVMANARMADYILPTSADTPPIRVIFRDVPYPHGPFGAKGLGELPIDGAAPAIVNAINHALGTRLDRIPALPEALMEALEPRT
jgi:CO/xanthine dehydrogenase Mo-binding subunit